MHDTATAYADLIATFERHFSRTPAFLARAPGRVNLIGEHTDYNDGYVFPAAIPHSVVLAVAPRNDQHVRLYSVKFENASEFDLDSITHDKNRPWSDYVRGVAHVLQSTGHALRGLDAVVTGDVPVASGLSSSAAFEVASCLAFEHASGFELDPKERALLCQRAEREFVGVQCGIMDQFISALGKKDHALLIDTRTLDYEAVPLPITGVAIVIGNTRKERGLSGSEYNTRREQCEAAVAALQRHLPHIRALRDVSLADLAKYGEELDPVVFQRARHVVSENERVLASVDALKRGDITRFGQLMNESHDSLRDDYDVSCYELNVMVDAARSLPGTYGSRMTGAGFGGCTVSLVASDAVTGFIQHVGETYQKATHIEPEFYVCTAADGAQVLPL